MPGGQAAVQNIEVLIRTQADDGRVADKAVRVAASQGESVSQLKKQVAEAEGVLVSSVTSVVFQGQLLEDSDVLDKCGLSAADGSEEWAEQRIYPNLWFLLAHRKAYVKATDPNWPPIRAAGWCTDTTWAWALAAVVLLGNMLLA